MASKPSTLPDLLLSRSKDSFAEIGFLNAEGRIASSMSYSDLYADASRNAQRLVAAGLKPGSDIVVTSFPDHESHIRILWSCLLAGIPVCPIPPLHPDPSCQLLFFENIQTIFHPRTDAHHPRASYSWHKCVLPEIKTLSLTELEGRVIDESTNSLVYPNRSIKPDDIACLMLTSGSTGLSKAVVLHHSNLLSSIRVHRPRNFLEWCSKLHITYTFSPNFLIAQICRDVTAAPYSGDELELRCMQTFIPEGEAVPVKTAVEFSDIIERHGAPRDALRAGFGMGETGAGSIYDTRPIVRDTSSCTEKYLSLGKYCEGLTIRVEDELCAEGIQTIMKTNQDIRNACIIFCQLAPHVVFALPRQSFVKTSLGKVSRTALMSSYMQAVHSALESKLHTSNALFALPSVKSPKTSVEEIVLEAIASALDKENLTLERSQSVFDIGVSSMHLMCLKHILEGQLDIQDLQTIELLKRPEFGQLCEYLHGIVEVY